MSFHVTCFYLEVLLFYTLRISGKELFGYYVFPEQELKACMLESFLMDGILDLNPFVETVAKSWKQMENQYLNI